MIEPADALRDVRARLREDVLPEVASPHGRAVLGAALGILDELTAQVARDVRPAAATVADLLPAIERWEPDLVASAPGLAAEVARRRREAAAEADPVSARALVLDAVALAVRTAWDELEPGDRDGVLSDARRALRADAERHGGGDD